MVLMTVSEEKLLAVFPFRLQSGFSLLHGFFPGIAKNKTFVLAESFQYPVHIAHFGLGALDAELAVCSAHR